MTEKPSWMAVIDEVGAVMSSLGAESASQLIDAIVDSPSVFVSGEGRSGLVARSFAMRLMHMGVAAYVMGETICPSISDGDLLVACSGFWDHADYVSQSRTGKEQERCDRVCGYGKT